MQKSRSPSTTASSSCQCPPASPAMSIVWIVGWLLLWIEERRFLLFQLLTYFKLEQTFYRRRRGKVQGVLTFATKYGEWVKCPVNKWSVENILSRLLMVECVYMRWWWWWWRWSSVVWGVWKGRRKEKKKKKRKVFEGGENKVEVWPHLTSTFVFFVTQHTITRRRPNVCCVPQEEKRTKKSMTQSHDCIDQSFASLPLAPTGLA